MIEGHCTVEPDLKHRGSFFDSQFCISDFLVFGHLNPVLWQTFGGLEHYVQLVYVVQFAVNKIQPLARISNLGISG